MTTFNPPEPRVVMPSDDGDWEALTELEQEIAHEQADALDKPAPKPSGWPTTAALMADLDRFGLRGVNVKLPERAWTVDEAHAELTRQGVKGAHFQSTRLEQIPLEQKWYASTERKR